MKSNTSCNSSKTTALGAGEIDTDSVSGLDFDEGSDEGDMWTCPPGDVAPTPITVVDEPSTDIIFSIAEESIKYSDALDSLWDGYLGEGEQVANCFRLTSGNAISDKHVDIAKLKLQTGMMEKE